MSTTYVYDKQRLYMWHYNVYAVRLLFATILESASHAEKYFGIAECTKILKYFLV